MPNTANITRLGLKQGGSDNRELFNILYGGMMLAAFEEDNWMRNLTMSKTIRGGKAHNFPVLGKTRAGRHTPGENLLVPDVNGASGINAAKLNTFAKSQKLVYIDEASHQSAFLVPKIDELLSQDGMEEMAIMARDSARSIIESVEATWLSTLLLNAIQCDTLKSGVDAALFSAGTDDVLYDSTLKNFTRRKASAAYRAGFTDSNPASVDNAVGGQQWKGNSFGYTISTLSTARAIRNELFRLKKYQDHLRIPKQGRFCMIGLDYYITLLEADDRYASSTGGMPELNRDLGGYGSSPGLTLPPIAGFTLIPTPYLTGVAGTGLGTQIQDILGVSSPTTNDELKYQPAAAPESTQLWQGNVVVQTVAQQTPGGAGTQPNTWAEWRDLYDKVAIIAGHSSAIGTVHGHELVVEGERKMEMDGFFHVARYYCGHGTLRPEAGCYVATAKVTTA